MPRTYSNTPEPRYVEKAKSVDGGSKKIHITITSTQFLYIADGGEVSVTIPDSESADIDAENSKNISFIIESVLNIGGVDMPTDLLLPYAQMAGNIRTWANLAVLADNSMMYARTRRDSTDEHNVVILSARLFN